MEPQLTSNVSASFAQHSLEALPKEQQYLPLEQGITFQLPVAYAPSGASGEHVSNWICRTSLDHVPFIAQYSAPGQVEPYPVRYVHPAYCRISRELLEGVRHRPLSKQVESCGQHERCGL